MFVTLNPETHRTETIIEKMNRLKKVFGDDVLFDIKIVDNETVQIKLYRVANNNNKIYITTIITH